MQRPAEPTQVASIDGALEPVLSSLPTRPGVVQLLGAGERPLMTARPSNLRRWVSSKLGASRSLAPGRRPRTELKQLAKAVRFVPTEGSFEQRLACERWLAAVASSGDRREVRPAYLQLDLEERFPRVSVLSEVPARGRVFGPFRERAAAERALKPLLRLFALRPCDYVFEPAPELPLGLSCFFAQVRSCVAPCLRRVSEEQYRELAAAAAAFLEAPDARPEETRAWLPEHCRDARGRALVVERVAGRFDVFPVLDGAVLESQAARVAEDELEALLGALRFSPPAAAQDDRVWLAAWLYEPRRRARFLAVGAGEDTRSLAARVRVVT